MKQILSTICLLACLTVSAIDPTAPPPLPKFVVTNIAGAIFTNDTSEFSRNLIKGVNTADYAARLGQTTNSFQGFAGVVSCVGDSLTKGAGASTTSQAYPSVLQMLVSQIVNSYGVGGQTSSQIAARVGAYDVDVSVSGNTIPASGSVSVSFSDANQCPISSLEYLRVYGSISGVYGYLSFDASTNTIFTRSTNGSALTVPSPTTWKSDASKSLGDLTVFWVGRNDLTTPEIVKSNSLALSEVAGTNCLFLSVLNSDSGPIGSIEYSNMTNVNQWLSVTFSNRFVDVWTPLLNAYDTNSEADRICWTNKVVPISLRSDGIHLNTLGYSNVANVVASYVQGMRLWGKTVMFDGTNYYTSGNINLESLRANTLWANSLSNVGTALITNIVTAVVQSGYLLGLDGRTHTWWITEHLTNDGTTDLASARVGSLTNASWQMPTGASNGYVLQSDASGNATWAPTTIFPLPPAS